MALQTVFVLLLYTCTCITSEEFRNSLADATYNNPNYSKLILPVRNISEPIDVTTGVLLRKILEVEEFKQLIKVSIWVRQYWNDAFLRWDPAAYNNISIIRVPRSVVWTPDMVLYANGGDNYESPDHFNVMVSHNGDVVFLYPALYNVACDMDIKYFPFDQQLCRIEFGSWSYDARSMLLSLKEENAADTTDYLENTAWELINFTGRNNMNHYGCCKNLTFMSVIYTIVIRRFWTIHFFYMLIPILLIQLLAVMQFLLPCDSAEKVILGITIYLSMLVYLLMVSEMLPSTQYIPALVEYIVSTLILVATAEMMTIIVLMIHHNGSHDNHRKLPSWARTFFLHWMASVLGMASYITSDDEHQQRLTRPKVSDDPSDNDSNHGARVQQRQPQQQQNQYSRLFPSPHSSEEEDEAVTAVHDHHDLNSSVLVHSKSKTLFKSNAKPTPPYESSNLPLAEGKKTNSVCKSVASAFKARSSGIKSSKVYPKMHSYVPDMPPIEQLDTSNEPHPSDNTNTFKSPTHNSNNANKCNSCHADDGLDGNDSKQGICNIIPVHSKCTSTEFCQNCHTQCKPAFVKCSDKGCSYQIQQRLDNNNYEYLLCCCKCMKETMAENSWLEELVPLKWEAADELTEDTLDPDEWVNVDSSDEYTPEGGNRNINNAYHRGQPMHEGRNWNSNGIVEKFSKDVTKMNSRQRRMCTARSQYSTSNSCTLLTCDSKRDIKTRLLQKIYTQLLEHKAKLSDDDVDAEVKCEWQQVAMVLDRMMFIVYCIGTALVVFRMYGNTPLRTRID